MTDARTVAGHLTGPATAPPPHRTTPHDRVRPRTAGLRTGPAHDHAAAPDHAHDRATAPEPEPWEAGAPRRRVLLAPITVTPSKPLTPSHLKGLLWADVLHRATALRAEVTYRYSHSTYHLTEQTLGFWEFLDRTQGDTDYRALSEEEIGALYVAHRAEGVRPAVAALRPYADAVEHHGWVHPAATRVLEHWTAHYARLGLHDPGLLAHQPPGLGLEEALERLAARGLCLDMRPCGGPVYLDATRHGLPLRQIVDDRGQPNYLACALRELLPLAPEFDETVLVYDQELEPDYRLLERVLGEFGTTVRRVTLGRVPIDGRIRSARHGDWQGHTAGVLLERAAAEFAAPALRLGMRMYFIAVLGRGQQQSFRPELLQQSCARAERLLAGGGRAPDPAPLAEVLDRHRGDRQYVDPYRLTSSLLAKHRPGPAPELLREVYL